MDPAIYQKTSPMSYIKTAKTPTLIQHGELDRRVPIANAYELRQGLEDRGVKVEMVVYKGFGHRHHETKIDARRDAAQSVLVQSLHLGRSAAGLYRRRKCRRRKRRMKRLPTRTDQHELTCSADLIDKSHGRLKEHTEVNMA